MSESSDQLNAPLPNSLRSHDATLPLLPPRDPAGHKGTFGTVGIFGGSASTHKPMIGAPAFAALAALRSGAGLARIAAPEPILTSILSLCPSATGLAVPTHPDGTIEPHLAAQALDDLRAQSTALVVGPGLGTGPSSQAAVLKAVQDDSLPLILDADGLNSLAQVPDFWLDFRAPTILTPHPGEFRTLANALDLAPHSHDPTNVTTRPVACAALAQRLGAIVVLKGQHTVVSDGITTWTCRRGHPCLGTAGTGDILAGLLGGLVAQFYRPVPPALAAAMARAGRPNPQLTLFNLACIAVECHAIAGEWWAHRTNAEAGLLAQDLATLLPAVIQSQRAASTQA